MLIESILQDVVLTEDDFKRVSQLVYEHCGINLHGGKKELVRARLAKRLRAKNFKSFAEYLDYAVNDTSGHEFSILIDSLSTNLTSFFREIQHFDFLQKTYLPHLAEKKHKAGSHKIRCWSAGCSSGEEPYSLAITLLDAFAGQGNWDIKVLATDISTTILQRAKEGIYEQKRIDPVSPQQRQKYLSVNRMDGEKFYEVNKLLRDVVIFRYLNLMADWPIGGPLDFIFCRNVMIYFDKPTQQRLIGRFYDLLDSGGLLFTGHSESLTGIKHNFKYIQPTIYAKP
jgi:chemotaxis protein methyltransferase CheR